MLIWARSVGFLTAVTLRQGGKGFLNRKPRWRAGFSSRRPLFGGAALFCGAGLGRVAVPDSIR